MSETAPTLSIVFPVLNEEDNIVPLIEEIQEVLGDRTDYEIVVVDDGSTDRTLENLQSISARVSDLHVLQLKENRGQSTALGVGLNHAVGKIIVMMDGDRQNDPHDIDRLLEEINKGADVCLTYRAKRSDTAWKKFQSKIANAVRNWILASDVRDTGSQLRAFRRECLKDLPCFDGMHRFMGNLMLMRGFKVVQIATHHRPRPSGKSKYGMRNRAWRGLKDLMGVRWLGGRAIRYELKDDKD